MENDTLDDALVSLIKIFIKRKLLFLGIFTILIFSSVGYLSYIYINSLNSYNKNIKSIVSLYSIGSYLSLETGSRYYVEDPKLIENYLNNKLFMESISEGFKNIEEKYIMNNTNLLFLKNECKESNCEKETNLHRTILNKLLQRHDTMMRAIKNNSKIVVIDNNTVIKSAEISNNSIQSITNKFKILIPSLIFFSIISSFLFVFIYEYVLKLKNKIKA